MGALKPMTLTAREQLRSSTAAGSSFWDGVEVVVFEEAPGGSKPAGEVVRWGLIAVRLADRGELAGGGAEVFVSERADRPDPCD